MISRADNLKRARLGMREDRSSKLDERAHPFSSGAPSRTIGYSPLRPPYSLDLKLPTLYRCELCDHLAKGHAKFSAPWEAVYSLDYTWGHYYRTFPQRPEESNPKLFQAWANKNPEDAKRLDAEWTEFLAGLKCPA